MEAPDSSVRSDNRKTARLKAELEVNLTADSSILYSSNYISEPFPLSLSLLGRTDNISEEGLAFILPSFHMNEEFCRDEKKSLQIGLSLPTELVTLRAHPVHCEPLDSRNPGRGYLLGVRIRPADNPDHKRYLRYLHETR